MGARRDPTMGAAACSEGRATGRWLSRATGAAARPGAGAGAVAGTRAGRLPKFIGRAPSDPPRVTAGAAATAPPRLTGVRPPRLGEPAAPRPAVAGPALPRGTRPPRLENGTSPPRPRLAAGTRPPAPPPRLRSCAGGLPAETVRGAAPGAGPAAPLEACPVESAIAREGSGCSKCCRRGSSADLPGVRAGVSAGGHARGRWQLSGANRRCAQAGDCALEVGALTPGSPRSAARHATQAESTG